MGHGAWEGVAEQQQATADEVLVGPEGWWLVADGSSAAGTLVALPRSPRSPPSLLAWSHLVESYCVCDYLGMSCPLPTRLLCVLLHPWVH